MAKIIVTTSIGMRVEVLTCDKPIEEIVKLLVDNGAKLKEE